MTPTAFDLLMSAPDDQVVRMKLVYKYIAMGEWDDAAHFMRSVVREGEGDWAERARILLAFCEKNAEAK